ncbi:twin-arginine translocase TatA/TatE family subunit [Raoultibacter phocaeensis]|uniref:twin-arginine translocase TatA/TatE family subunit n=1 Tax=Raoultibacter phocaeensis TaxID=2479841 RepID=UPI001118B8B3|nr:twin-arginine translocase TatA/TatE family subunit [Raoultibacter phocaeensis]
MKLFGLGIPELVLILVVVLLIFGPKNLPKLGGMLGRSVKKLRARTDEKFDDETDADDAETKAQPA